MASKFALRGSPCDASFVSAGLQGSYDGVWSVTVVTNAGNCEANTRYPLTVLDCKVIGSPDVSGER
jgi:hypothetical protein